MYEQEPHKDRAIAAMDFLKAQFFERDDVLMALMINPGLLYDSIRYAELVLNSASEEEIRLAEQLMKVAKSEAEIRTILEVSFTTIETKDAIDLLILTQDLETIAAAFFGIVDVEQTTLLVEKDEFGIDSSTFVATIRFE